MFCRPSLTECSKVLTAGGTCEEVLSRPVFLSWETCRTQQLSPAPYLGHFLHTMPQNSLPNLICGSVPLPYRWQGPSLVRCPLLTPEGWGITQSCRAHRKQQTNKQSNPNNQENPPNQTKTASWVWTNFTCCKLMEICTPLLFINPQLFREFFLFNQFGCLCSLFKLMIFLLLLSFRMGLYSVKFIQ